MLTAQKSLARVLESAEKIRNNQPQRFPEAASPGDTWRQGDIYIERLTSIPSGCIVDDKPNPQLAPGTTQGSRHVIDSLQGVTVYLLPNPTALDGPVLDVVDERVVTHPEHGHVVLPPGVYGVTYQRAFAEELRRQAD